MITRSLARRRSGQGMTEYIILVGLIAILLIGVVSRYGEVIKVTIIGTAEEVETKVNTPMANAGGASDDGGSSNRNTVRISDSLVTRNADGTYTYRNARYEKVDTNLYRPIQ